MTTGERRELLKLMFAGLYFDRHGRLVRALAHEPFDDLLQLPADGYLLG